MKFRKLITISALSVLFFSCSDQSSQEKQDQRVEELRQEGKQLQESVQEMQPELDAEAQNTIDKVEERVKNQESP